MKEASERLQKAWQDVFGSTRRPWGAMSKIETELNLGPVPPRLAINALRAMKTKGIGPSFPYLKSTIRNQMLSSVHESLETDSRSTKRGEMAQVSSLGTFVAALVAPGSDEQRVEAVMEALIRQFGRETVRRTLRRMSEKRQRKPEQRTRTTTTTSCEKSGPDSARRAPSSESPSRSSAEEPESPEQRSMQPFHARPPSTPSCAMPMH